MDAATLAQLYQWIPASVPADTFRGVGRTADRRLSGVRLPLSEQWHRNRARMFAEMARPKDLGMHWILWCMRRASADVIERLDAERAWENEGGA